MNKKFSTLVAALLVSGAGYAVVSTFNAYPLANSPIVKAASANLRSSSLTPTQSVIKTGELVAGDFSAPTVISSTQVFKAKTILEKIVLVTPDEKAYLAADGSLSDDFNEAAVAALSTAKYVTVGGAKNYLILSKEGITVRTADNDNAATAGLVQGEQLVKAYQLNDATATTTLGDGVSYLLGGELAPKIPSALKMNFELEEVPTEFKGVPVGSGNTDPGADATFEIITRNSATDYVVRLKEGQFAKVVDGKLTAVADIAEASVIGFDGSYQVYFDGVEANLLNIDGTVTSSGTAVKGYKTYNATAANGSTAVGNIFFVDNTVSPNLNTNAGTFLHFALKDPTSVTIANEAPTKNLYSFDEELQFTASAAAASAQLLYTAGEYSYKLNFLAETAGTKATFIKASEAAMALKIGAGGTLQTNSSSLFVTLKNGELVLSTGAGATGEQIYVWKKAANKMPELLTSGASFPLSGVILSTSNTEVGGTITVGDSYLKYDLSQTLMPLVDGAYYYLEDNTGANCLIPSEKAGATADDPAVPVLGNQVKSTIAENNLAGLWKVTAYKNENGVVTHYSFKYRADETKNLAFDVKFNRTTNLWEVSYNPEGKYTRFVVDKKGFISFTADEKATVKGKPYTNNKQYALSFKPATTSPAAAAYWSIAEYDKTSEQLNIAKGEDIIITGDEAAKQVEWLNVTAGNGVGFGVFYVGSDGKKVTLEDNVMVKNQITAVQGPNLEALGGTQADLSDKVFLKISGDYKYADPAKSGNKKTLAESQLAAFRDAKFVVVDTVLYSAMIADAKPYYYLTDAKGSDMISAKGYHANQATTYAALVKTDGNFVGLKRRLENAEFEVHHPKGSVYSDPVYFTIPSVMMPADKYNEKGLINSNLVGANDGYASAAPLYLAVKQYDNKYYLGAADDYSHLFISKNNDVDYTKVNGLVNIISRNYKTDGQVYANDDNTYGIVKVLPKYVCLDKPEGQYLVTGGNYNKYNEIQPFTFTNRESGRSDILNSVSLKTVTDENGKVKENIYSIVGRSDTVEIKAVALTNEYVGYKNYTKKELDNTEYVLKFRSTAGGVGDLYITEENHSTDHALGLNTDTLVSATFRLIKFEAKGTTGNATGDTVRVSNGAYSYLTADKEYAADKNDRVVAFTYAIYNADNKEFLASKDGSWDKGESLENFFYCNPELKYAGASAEQNAANAQRFIIKEKADGTIQLIPTSGLTWSAVNHKLYAGITDNKIYAESTIYKRTDNDLFKIVPVGAPMYRTIAAAPFDTIRIYKESMDNVALFAQTADKEIVSGNHFLGMAHKADVKAQYSFFVDTAYVNVGRETSKPQYMLVLDADTVHGKYTCNDPSHDPHISAKIDTVYGKYLVAMDDSAQVWKAAGKHNNPYEWDQYPRLGFVNAKHYGDSLVVIRDNGIQSHRDTINLADNADVQGVFAFRIVDQETKSFKMETGLYRNAKDEFETGWVKWLNGVPVVISDIDQAEVFNFEPTTNIPTANEGISTSEVSVIAGNGDVTINGAAGKKVTISNVLGQTIANTVLSSDNATIAAPAGIVVVAVEGEAAVKAIVK